MKYRYGSAILIALIGMAPSVFAHPGHENHSGFGGGWTHPFSGLDHILAMVAVGLLAGQRGGRSTWLVPAAFLFTMVIGGWMSLAGVSIPLVQPGILASVVVLGTLVAMATSVPPSALIVLPGLFAICHGYAHVAEMSSGTSPVHYALGFILATATLHAVGIGVGWASSRFAPMAFTRFSGAAIAACGVLLFAHVL
jgi:urease accessory protein